MKKIVAALLLTALFSVPAVGQTITGTVWQAEFDKYDAYLDFGQRTLIVWTRQKDGSCARYPSTIEWESNGITLPESGTRWFISQTPENNLRVHFPDGRDVVYKPVRIKPSTLCMGDGEGI